MSLNTRHRLLFFSPSVVSDCYPMPAACQASLFFTVSQSLLKLLPIESVIQPNHLILCHPLLLLPLIFPSIRVFPMSWLFASGGQSIGASASVLPMNVRGWFPLGLTDLNSLLPKGLPRVFFWTTVQKCQFLCSSFFMVQLSHPYMTTWKNIPLTNRPLSAKWCLCILICCLGLSKLFFWGANVF